MLEVIEYGKDEYEFPALLVLGCFDAIHAGHRDLLKKAKLQAKINGLDLGVMMFRDGKGGKLVYSFEERCAFLEQYNVKFVLAVDFNDEFKSIAPLDFLHAVEDQINVKAYMSGKDFRFGAGAKGKSSTLKNYAEDEENGVWYMPVKDVDFEGVKISTTLIKSCLDEGNVAKANALLGSEFSVSGEVVRGEGRGSTVVGFPTVNIVYPEWKHPLKHGVYSVKCLVGDIDYQGIANFGTCPTFGDERVALEVYLEGFSGDLYGQVLTIRFVDFIRDIEQFASAEELSGQLQNDLSTVSDELAVAEEPAEEVVEEQPAEEPVEEVVEEQPAEEPVEEVEEGLDDMVDDGLDDFAEPSAEEIVEEQPEEEPAEEVIEEQPAEDVADVADEVTEEQPAEETADEVVVEQPEEEFVEEVVEEQPEQTAASEETAAGNSDGTEMEYSEGEATDDAATDEPVITEIPEQPENSDEEIQEQIEIPEETENSETTENSEETEIPEEEATNSESKDDGEEN